MLDTENQVQQQVWAAQRLYRICRITREASSSEPCLEQYEQQVQLVTGEELTAAVAAWIALIAEQLRLGKQFVAEEYVAGA